MWGTLSPDGKLTGDLGKAIESTEIDGRRSRRPLAGKLSPGDFRLLQQYRPVADARGRVSQSRTWARHPAPAQAQVIRDHERLHPRWTSVVRELR